MVPAAPCWAVRAGDHVKVNCLLKKSFLLSDRQRFLAPPLLVLAATWPALGYPNGETASSSKGSMLRHRRHCQRL
jgi:hypothetical protein